MKSPIFYLLLFFTLSVFSQQRPGTNIIIIGSVYDSEAGIPLPYATVTLQDIKTNNFSGGVTNNLGRFKVEIPPGKYKLSIEFLSFEPFTVKVMDLTQDTDLGKIELKPDYEKLKEIEINSGKSIISYKFDKKVYYAAKDIANTSGTAITVLENTPAVHLDDSGNIILRGNKAKILVNGKPYGNQDNISDVLGLIPSNTISKVEIISPSAKYDSEGGGGIINIILKKGKGNGYSGIVEVHGAYPANDGISSFINYKSAKVNVYSTMSFNHNVKIKNTDLRQQYYDSMGDLAGQMDQDRNDDRQKNSFLFNIGSDFNIDKKNTVTTSLMYTLQNKDYDSELDLTDLDAFSNLIGFNKRKVGDHTDEGYLEALVNYTTIFNSDDHRLSFDLRVDRRNSENMVDIKNQISYPEDKVILQNSDKIQILSNYMAKADYQLPLKNNGMIEAGGRLNFRRYSNDFEFNTLNQQGGGFGSSESYRNDLQYKEDIFAGYVTYKKQYERFNFSGGLRLENSNTSVEDLLSEDITENNYTNLFPNINLGYVLKDESMLSFNYIRYIDRPRVDQLNPYTSVTDNRFIQTGNPYLQPYYTDFLLLEYYREFAGKLTFSTAMFFNHAKDQIRYVIQDTGEQTGDDFNIYIRKPFNDGNLDQLGVEFNFIYMPTQQLRFRWYISPYYFKIHNTEAQRYDYEDFVVYTNLIGDYRFKGGLRFQLNYTLQSPKKDALTELKTIQFLNATVSKDLFKKKATLTFKANDILQTRTYDFSSFEADTFTHKIWRFDSVYSLSFTYRFNKARKRNSHNKSKEIGKDVFDIDEDIR